MGVNESTSSTVKTFGFRIYKLIKNGPWEKSNLHEIDDFIIPPEEMFQKKIPFCDWIKEKADQKITLSIYSLSKRSHREVEIQTNKADSKEGLLGGAVRYENYETASKKVLHVIKVKEGSFAHTKLRLTADDDYFIGMRPNKGDILALNKSEGDLVKLFGAMINQNLGNECEFFIYNRNKGARAVTAKIENNDYFEWGCEVAYGKIHEFPYDKQGIDEEEKKLKEEMGETQII